MSKALAITRAIGVIMFIALFAAATSPIAAQDSPSLDGPVTDLVSAVAGSEGPIAEAIEELRAEGDVQLFALYTDTTGGAPVEQYAADVASDNGLGVGDALYVIATEDRTHVLWVADSLTDRLSVDAQDRALLEAEDRLAEGDLAGASVALAGELRETLTGGGLPLLPILLVGGLGVALVGGWFLLSRRRGEADVSQRLEQLETEAATLLLETDEQVRNGSGELGYVEAMYGPSEVQPYAAAIEQAREELNAAFAIQQRLDDSEPEDAPTREALLGQVVEHARKAQAALQEQQARIRELRDIERDAPKLLEDLTGRLAALEARLPDAERVRSSLEAYVASDWEAVRGNHTEAVKRIASARESIAEARTALESKDAGQAALEVRESVQAVSEATGLLDSLDGAARELAAARERIEPELQETATDIALARDAVARDPSAERETRLAEAVAMLDEARRLAGASPMNVLGTLERANSAEALADELVAGAREAEEARRRQATVVQGTIASARAKVEMAASYVSTRHHGVGSTARVRAAEAERHLQAAIGLQEADPEAALIEARRAESLADEARRSATSDFDTWDQRPPVAVESGGPDLGGLILGSVLGSILSGGGGGSGPGWGGTSWGGGMSGGRGRPPSSRLPGLGGGSRSRGGGGGRSMGGGVRSGGGGGRARGGRW